MALFAGCPARRAMAPLVCRPRNRPFGQPAERRVRPCTICYRQPRIKLLTGKGRSMEVLGQLQVVDLTDGIAGPITGMFMADFGAEVIKIEPPGGHPDREQPGFSMWNRGKKSVTVDPANADQCRWLGDLIAGCDICIVRDEATFEQFKLSSAALSAAQCTAAHREDAALCADHALAWRPRVAGAVVGGRRRRLAPVVDRRRPDRLRCFRICSTCRAFGRRSAPSPP